jgi:hypothetical protein
MFAAAKSECIEACATASQLCEQCAMNSLITGESHDDAVLRCLDCVAIATMASLVVARASPLAIGAAALCAAACERCADSCDGIDDLIWKRCGAACRDAGRCCRELAAMCDRREVHVAGRDSRRGG